MPFAQICESLPAQASRIVRLRRYFNGSDSSIKPRYTIQPKSRQNDHEGTLGRIVADQRQLSKPTSHEMLNDLISIITKHLPKGERVKIAGLGILHVRDQAARIGRNLKTGEAVEIKAGEKVSFRAAKKLKMAIYVDPLPATRDERCFEMISR